ncbi:hypothetical protein BDV24DRAFT_140459 [Aspergillus arachidicola]|uniref:Uncharacterized protein n=1 Tax=Aspergillus arachidicola TaxID=656916 RepID=A0A5N6XWW0_9EURO|nr:hypothetical protein BDV24DRAFT_140459 [Aspergillus arachidicola]
MFTKAHHFAPLFFHVCSVNFVCFVTAVRPSFDFVDCYLVLICFDNIPVLWWSTEWLLISVLCTLGPHT